MFYFLVAQFRGVMCDKSCLLIACGILSRSYLIAQLQDSAQMTSWNGLPQCRQKEIMVRVIFTEYCDRPIPKRGRTESRRSPSSSGTRLRAFSPHSQTSAHSVQRDSPGGSRTGIVPLCMTLNCEQEPIIDSAGTGVIVFFKFGHLDLNLWLDMG